MQNHEWRMVTQHRICEKDQWGVGIHISCYSTRFSNGARNDLFIALYNSAIHSSGIFEVFEVIFSDVLLNPQHSLKSELVVYYPYLKAAVVIALKGVGKTSQASGMKRFLSVCAKFSWPMASFGGKYLDSLWV